jgi:hypothetical protein
LALDVRDGRMFPPLPTFRCSPMPPSPRTSDALVHFLAPLAMLALAGFAIDRATVATTAAAVGWGALACAAVALAWRWRPDFG